MKVSQGPATDYIMCASWLHADRQGPATAYITRAWQLHADTVRALLQATAYITRAWRLHAETARALLQSTSRVPDDHADTVRALLQSTVNITCAWWLHAESGSYYCLQSTTSRVPDNCTQIQPGPCYSLQYLLLKLKQQKSLVFQLTSHKKF